MRLSEDKAWRVRWCLTNKLYDIGSVLLFGNNPPTNSDHYNQNQVTIVSALEAIAENLLNDQESEVLLFFKLISYLLG